MKHTFAALALSITLSTATLAQTITCQIEDPGNIPPSTLEINLGDAPGWKLLQDNQVMASESGKKALDTKIVEGKDAKEDLKELLERAKLESDDKLISELTSLTYLVLNPKNRDSEFPIMLLTAKSGDKELRRMALFFLSMGVPLVLECK